MKITEMNWMQVESYLERDDRAVVPIGSTEQHAGLSLGVDLILSESHSGIWRDLAVRKRPTEVDAQLAIVADLAAGHGLTTPVVDRLVGLVHEIEDGRRPMQRANLDALAELA